MFHLVYFIYSIFQLDNFKLKWGFLRKMENWKYLIEYVRLILFSNCYLSLSHVCACTIQLIFLTVTLNIILLKVQKYPVFQQFWWIHLFSISKIYRFINHGHTAVDIIVSIYVSINYNVHKLYLKQMYLNQLSIPPFHVGCYLSAILFKRWQIRVIMYVQFYFCSRICNKIITKK